MSSQGLIAVQGRKLSILDRNTLEDLAAGEKFAI